MGRKILIFIIVLCIVSIGGFLRIYRLDKAPPSANWDEASYAYNAYSLWTTGKDEYGSLLPTSIRSFDDYKPPLYAYATAPIVGTFGLNEITARIVSAICGTLTLLLLFIVATKISRNMWVGIAASAVAATSPELVHFSRLGFEAVLALLLFLAGLSFFLVAKKRPNYYFGGLFMVMLSAFAYNSHKVYFLIACLYVFLQLKKELFTFKRLLCLGLILLPIGFTSIFTPALARFSGTSIFPLFWQTHSVYLFIGELINRYVGYFSPANIFVRGTNEPGQQVYNFAVFFPFLAVPWLVGLRQLFTNSQRMRFLVGWLMLAPLPAVLTWNWFTPVRIMPFWALLSIVIGMGLVQIFTRIGKLKYILLVFVIGWWGISTIWLYHRIEYVMPYLQTGRWQWGFREVIATIEPVLDTYDKVIWDTPQAQPYIFVLFYSSYPAAKYHNEIDPVTKSGSARKIYDFGKYEFREIYWPKDRSLKNTLFIGDQYSLPESDIKRDNVKILNTVLSPEGYVVYYIVGT